MPLPLDRPTLLCATLVTLALTSLACAPKLAGSTTLRMKSQLDKRCLESTLKQYPGVSRVWGSDPIHFRYTPPEQSRGYDFKVRQEQVGLTQGWTLMVSGEVLNNVSDAGALANDLGPHVTALRDELARACGAELLPTE